MDGWSVRPLTGELLVNKLKLNLEDLGVESFDTRADVKGKGTVVGEQCSCAGTCYPAPTCANTCAYTCDDATCPACPTCAVSCNGTCGYSCIETCVPPCVDIQG
jgi:hypothetical protein